MTRWERLEMYLFDYDKDGGDFAVEEYATEATLDISEGSRDIQSYLRAQRSRDSKTLYVLRRVQGTRTSNARWAVGVRTKDARMIGRAFHDDTMAKVKRAFVPDLLRLRALNPRAARNAERQIEAVVDHAMQILALAAEGMNGR